MITDKEVRRALYALLEETGRAPSVDELAGAARAHPDFVGAALLVLEGQGLLVRASPDAGALSDGTLVPPFALGRAPHEVECLGVTYGAASPLDALGILAAFDRDGLVRTTCPHGGGTLEVVVGFDGPEPSEARFHTALPMDRWIDEPREAAAGMGLFASQEAVEAWCAARGLTSRPSLPVSALWVLALRLYGDRFDGDFAPPEEDELAERLRPAGLPDGLWNDDGDAVSDAASD